MKKYSRISSGRKTIKKKTPNFNEGAEHIQCQGGDGDQVEELGKIVGLDTKDNHLQTEVDGNGEHGAEESFADLKIEAYQENEATSNDLKLGESTEPTVSEQLVPLPLVWGNGMQFPAASAEPGIIPTGTTGQYPLTNPIPIFPVPHFNPHLPFPDQSGTTSLLTSMGMQNPALQPPAPTLNASLGFPSVYVSPAGLITVLLKYDIAVEMTVDKNLRVVNHRHKAVAATNSRGSSNCVYHVAAKVFHDGTKTEVEVFGERRARMQTNGILFASGLEVYLLDDNHIIPSQFIFNDMSKDSSVNILFTPGTAFANDLLVHCDEITKNSKYYFHKDGSTTIIINNIKIHQDEHGEVQVISGPRYICTSPVYGSVYLQTHFIEVSVQVNWNVSVQRGSQKTSATYTNFVVCNGQHEAGFNSFRDVFSRPYNSIVSEFESWLPSLTFLTQGLPQMKKNRMHLLYNSRDYQKNRFGDGDQNSSSMQP